MTASRFNGKTTAARERLAAAILAWSTLAPPHLCLASADVHSSFFAQLPTRSRGDKSYVLAHASSPFTKRERQTRFQTQKKRLALFPTRPWICRNRFWQCCWKRGKSQVKPTDYRKLDPAVQWLQCVSFQCFPRHFCPSFEWCGVVSPPSRKPSLSFILFLVLSPPYSFLCCLAAICRRRGHWRTPTGCGPRHNVGFVCVSSINSGRRRCLFSRLHGWRQQF